MITILFLFDAILAASLFMLWICYQTLAKSHYELTQWVKREFDKR